MNFRALLFRKPTLPTKRFHNLLSILLISSLSQSVFSSDLDAQILKRLELMEQRLQALESENTRLKKALNEPYISNSEPEITPRLKALESQSNSYKRIANIVDSLEGIEAEAGLTMVAQGLSGEPDGYYKDSELNYRGDVSISLPAGDIGNAEGLFFAHFRFGQGLGLENPGSAFSSFNSTSFQRPGTITSDSTVLLAQAWYQLNIPLPPGGTSNQSRQHFEINIGKMDPFLFFDQNKIADDETRGFTNQAFVHNPLLDVGGDIGADDFGFTPGFRLAWVNDALSPEQYSLSFGAFGAGDGASFEHTFSDPFYIIQAETQQYFFTGLSGNYRIYYWQNHSAEDLRGNKQTHAGFGVSLDQQIHDYTTVFTRIGHHTKGVPTFDDSITLGVEFGGSYWNRGGDALGIAYGWLSLSDEYKDSSMQLNGYQASGEEQVSEIYYRYRINKQIDLSPNLQYIHHPGGNTSESSMTAFGLRAQVNL